MSAVVEPQYDWRDHHGMRMPDWDASEREKFAEFCISHQRRPWDWVLSCYPWGEPGSPLEKRMPEVWQRTLLLGLQEELLELDVSVEDALNKVIRRSVAAGNGVGKTALVAWLIHWFESCFPNGEAIITAGTRDQLSGKTWRELAKWQPLAINGWMFEHTNTAYTCVDAPKTWFAEARAWSEANPQAMAGTHEKYVLIIFDEASGIAPIIWETVEGALTTGLVLFFAFGNPSEAEGGFYNTQRGRGAAAWHPRRVDAREVTFANHEELNSWIDLHGADSDFCRIHIYGMFPKQNLMQFISQELVSRAAANEVRIQDIPRAIPRLMAVDIARQGGDMNVIVRRQGRKLMKDIKMWGERDTMKTAEYIARAINEHRPDLCFIDGVGVGGPVIDYLRQRGYGNVIVEVQSGRAPDDKKDIARYGNMRVVMWARMREWLQTADIPDTTTNYGTQLQEELCAPQYRYLARTDKELVESKDEMRARGIASPNIADALSYTFWMAIPVASTSATGVAETEM